MTPVVQKGHENTHVGKSHLFFVTGASKTLAATSHQVRKTNHTSELKYGETLQASLRTRSP